MVFIFLAYMLINIYITGDTTCRVYGNSVLSLQFLYKSKLFSKLYFKKSQR